MWTYHTYAGVTMSGTLGGWRTSLFEFHRAIQERMWAAGMYPYVPPFGPGSPSYPTVDSYIGLKLSGVNSPFTQSSASIRSGLIGLCNGVYTESMGELDYWSLSSLSAAVGFDLMQGPRSTVDTEWYQAIHDALDLLVWYTRSKQHVPGYIEPEHLLSPNGATTRTQGYVASGQPGATYPHTNPPPYLTSADAWDNRGFLVQHYPHVSGDDSIGGGVPLLMCGYGMNHDVPLGTKFGAWTDVGAQSVIIDVRDMDNGAEHVATWHEFSGINESSEDIDVSFDAATFTLPAGSANATYTAYDAASLVVSTLNYKTMVFPEPSTCPFPSSGTYAKKARATVKKTLLCFDGTPVFSDKV